MISVYLPQNNTSLLRDLTNEVLQDVCNRLFSVSTYTVVKENRQSGRYIRIVNDVSNETHIVVFSNPNNDSRNARLMQFVSPAFVAFSQQLSINKQLDIYLINQSEKDVNGYMNMFYRCFATLGINLINLEVATKIVPFNSYEDLKIYRKQSSLRNKHNSSTYFTDDDNKISIYGKTFGANAMESFIFGLTIKRITDKPIVFYPVLDNSSENLSSDQHQILSVAGVSMGENIKLLPSGYAKPTSDTSRNQTVFKYNLLQKFGDQQCYLCGCNLEHLIIAAHIERVTDIDKNDAYTPNVKAERSTDGDNGLWLCASHDKMFEYGLVYFINSELTINSNISDLSQKQYIEKSIYEMRAVYFSDPEDYIFNIKTEHYTDKMRKYLSKHSFRLNDSYLVTSQSDLYSGLEL